MKSLFAAFLLTCMSQSAYALKPASKDELAELNGIFTTIKGVGELIAKNRELRERASASDKAAFDQELELLQREREIPCRQALWLTMKAYGLLQFEGDQPKMLVGKSHLRSPEIGKEITWIPKFEEKKAYDIQNAIGRRVSEKLKPIEDNGNTASDGVSRIFPEAYTTPAELASTIYHERIHFEQFIDPKLAGIKTPAELEVDAYAKQKEVLRRNSLGMTPEEKEREKSYLKKQLALYEAKAAIQRAKVTKGKGLPIDEYSIVSHPEEELQRLIAQAREQLKIAQHDHDIRLRNTVATLAEQFCRTPESVTQGVLDELQLPHDRGYKQNLPFPADLDSCASWLYMDIQKGSSAEEIKSRAISLKRMSVPAQPAPPMPSPFTPAPPLSSIFGPLREFVIGACSGTLQAAHMEHRFGTYVVHFAEDDAAISVKYIGAGNNCEKALFQKIIEKTRSNYGRFHLTDPWVRGVVAANPPKVGTPPGDTAPPDAVPPGVRPPPDQTHPIIPIPGDPWKPRKVKHASANK